MYRQIDFSTDYKDEQGREYYRPPTCEIARLIRTLHFDSFKIGYILDCLVLKIFVTPIFQCGSLFKAERTGEKKHIATFIYNVDTKKLKLIKEYEEKNNKKELTVPELLFSYLRPCDIIEIKCLEKKSTGKRILVKYAAFKSKLEHIRKVKKLEYYPDELVFDKSLFYRKEFPYKKGGK